MTYYSLLLPLQPLSCSLHFESLSSSTLLLFHNVGPDAFCRRSNFWLPLPGNCGYHSPGFHLHGDCALLFPFSCNMCRTFLVQKSIAGTKIVPSQMNENTFPMPKNCQIFFIKNTELHLFLAFCQNLSHFLMLLHLPTAAGLGESENSVVIDYAPLFLKANLAF